MRPDQQRMMALWIERGLITEGLGPEAEWSPVSPDQSQKRHQAFWSAVSGMMPDDEHDEPYWMSEDATTRLSCNSLFRNN